MWLELDLMYVFCFIYVKNTLKSIKHRTISKKCQKSMPKKTESKRKFVFKYLYLKLYNGYVKKNTLLCVSLVFNNVVILTK